MGTAFDFPRAEVVDRGCGASRTPGGVYVEMGLVSEGGVPFDTYLVDAPLQVPEGLRGKLANKPQFWTDPQTNIVHLVIHIGKEHYPFLPDYVAESRLFGISRRISPNVLDRPEAAKLSHASKLILVHPRAINLRWAEQTPPLDCKKNIPFHTLESLGSNEQDELDGPEEIEVVDAVTAISEHFGQRSEVDGANQTASSMALSVHTPRHLGPCLYKLSELLPECERADDPDNTGFLLGSRMRYFRKIGSTTYMFAPSGEAEREGVTADSLYEEGVFGCFPISCFSLVRNANGAFDEKNTRRLERLGADTHLPFYLADE